MSYLSHRIKKHRILHTNTTYTLKHSCDTHYLSENLKNERIYTLEIRDSNLYIKDKESNKDIALMLTKEIPNMQEKTILLDSKDLQALQTTLGLHTHRDRVEIYVEVEKPYYIDSEGYLHWEVEGEERIKSQKIKVLNTDKKTYKDFDIRKQIIGNLGHTADLKTDDFDERGLIKFKAIVLHRTNEEMALSTLNTYTNKNVAGAHFLIDKDGTIYQTEILKKYTWHVGDIRPKQYDAGISKPNEKSIIDTIWNNKSSSYKVKKIKVSDYEKTKSYPNRYPINSDSIGIEVVGKYKSNQWEVATQAQKDSIKNLVEILKEEYNLNNDDVYEHDDISPQKVRGEAKGLYEKE